MTQEDDLKCQICKRSPAVLNEYNHVTCKLHASLEPTRFQMRLDFEKGYQDGFNDKGYQPISRSYIEGYESGELARERRKKR